MDAQKNPKKTKSISPPHSRARRSLRERATTPLFYRHPTQNRSHHRMAAEKRGCRHTLPWTRTVNIEVLGSEDGGLFTSPTFCTLGDHPMETSMSTLLPFTRVLWVRGQSRSASDYCGEHTRLYALRSYQHGRLSGLHSLQHPTLWTFCKKQVVFVTEVEVFIRARRPDSGRLLLRPQVDSNLVTNEEYVSYPRSYAWQTADHLVYLPQNTKDCDFMRRIRVIIQDCYNNCYGRCNMV
jgi:hypothetical protein